MKPLQSNPNSIPLSTPLGGWLISEFPWTTSPKGETFWSFGGHYAQGKAIQVIPIPSMIEPYYGLTMILVFRPMACNLPEITL